MVDYHGVALLYNDNASVYSAWVSKDVLRGVLFRSFLVSNTVSTWFRRISNVALNFKDVLKGTHFYATSKRSKYLCQNFGLKIYDFFTWRKRM